MVCPNFLPLVSDIATLNLDVTSMGLALPWALLNDTSHEPWVPRRRFSMLP